MGCGISKSFVWRAECEIFLAITYFCSYYITDEEINDLEKLLLVSCDALERSSNSYIESILEPCISKNQKGIFAMWV